MMRKLQTQSPAGNPRPEADVTPTAALHVNA
jgi:hypothetical protein